MKQTMKYLSIAALVVMGAIVASCAKEEPAQPEEITPEVVEPVAEDNIVVCTTTVSFDNSADTDETKALDEDGVKTFAAGDKIAVIYKNGTNQTVKAESNPLPAGVYDHSATFTVSLTNPAENAAVRIIYPAAMAASTVATNVAVDADATINYAALNTQDGTLATLSSNLDLAVYDGTLSGTSLPADPALKNKLAICEYTIKDDATPTANDLTSTITGMTISDGTHNYGVSRSAAAGPIYVAIRPTDNADINYTATDGTNHYKKTVTGKTYAASQMYPLGLRMAASNIIDLSTLTDDYVAQHGDVLIKTLGVYKKISIAAGATVTLNNATINGVNNDSYSWAGITCLGDATIVLEGTNSMKGFYEDYPGIQAAHNTGSGDEYTLTIQGTGSLTASSNGWGAGIGGGYNLSSGSVLINSGTIVASGGREAAGIGSGGSTEKVGVVNCGTITITGGDVTATGGVSAAGIGSGCAEEDTENNCGAITITNTVTRVTATKGDNAPNSIGAGLRGTCDKVTIGGVVGAITESPYTYPAPAPAYYSGSVGQVITSDGGLYDNVDAATAASKTPVAMIAYVGSSSDCAHGLAIALANETGTMDWATAGTTAAGKTSVTGGTWRAPTSDDWQYMAIACGSDQAYNSSHSYSSLSSVWLRYNYINEKLSTAAGSEATITTGGGYYWSGTTVEENSGYAFSLDTDNYGFQGYNKTASALLRAVLAY